MLVAVDAGNSEVKLALIRDGRVVALRRRPSRSRVAGYDAEGLLLDALSGEPSASQAPETDAVEGFVLVSVVPGWTEAVTELAVRMRRPVLEATARTLPIATNVREPERAGADRLLDAFAALRLHGAPVIVVDLGTATTVDAVDASGTFVGGAIAPGLELGLAALASGTAQLPRVAAAVPVRAIGRDTSEAIASGAVLGHVGVVRELVARVGAELDAPDRHGAAGQPGTRSDRPKVVATGGLSAASWMSLLEDVVDVVDPQLTMKGLALLHAEVGAGVTP